MVPSPKFIYFDLDDTLLDHKLAERKALNDIHQHFDLFDNISSRQLIDIYHDVNSAQWKLYSRAEVTKNELQRNRFEITLQELGLNKNRHAQVGSQYMRFYQNHWQWMDGARPAFESIKKHYPVGILTNGFTETQKKKFAQFDLYNQAKHLVISEDVGVMKPHPDVFDHATKLTGHQPHEILYVGDSYSSDVTGGTNFGWNVAWFKQDGDLSKHVKADIVFNDFKYLTDLLKV